VPDPLKDNHLGVYTSLFFVMSFRSSEVSRLKGTQSKGMNDDTIEEQSAR